MLEQAKRNIPEAVTFVGFVVEQGLLGQRADAKLAARYYAAAAARQYQPALFNLALQVAYGRGRADDAGTALGWIEQAAAVAQAKSRPTPVDEALIARLRQTASSGTDDGLAMIEAIGRANLHTDRQFLYCKYAVLRSYRQRSDTADLEQAAGKCIDSVSASMPGDLLLMLPREQAARTVAGFVIAERAALNAMRKTSPYHYGRSVPYLPLSQAEVALFEPGQPSGNGPGNGAGDGARNGPSSESGKFAQVQR